jgi:hypothetical protein
MQFNTDETVTTRSQILGLYFRAYTEKGDESYNAADVKHILQATSGRGKRIPDRASHHRGHREGGPTSKDPVRDGGGVQHGQQ